MRAAQLRLVSELKRDPQVQPVSIQAPALVSQGGQPDAATMAKLEQATLIDPKSEVFQMRVAGRTDVGTKEAKALISLSCDAVSQISEVTHGMHSVIYQTGEKDTSLNGKLTDALSCLQTAEHYLRMLHSVLQEQAIPPEHRDPWADDHF